jgi:hypothetical protein
MSRVRARRGTLLSLSAPGLLLSGCADGGAPSMPPLAGAAGSGATSSAVLQLVTEKKLSQLVGGSGIEHYEASGVVARDGTLFVASDNLEMIAAIDPALEQGRWGPGESSESQYEAITVSDDGRFLLVVESNSPSDRRAKVVSLDASSARVSEAFTDATFGEDDGFEGLAWLRVAGQEYLLALCQNNACRAGDSQPGQGRVKLLTPVDGVWATRALLDVPADVRFRNYSDLALLPKSGSTADGTYSVAIVSHQSSALWLGTLTTAPWALTGPGSVHAFPRSATGEVQYCTVEGVTFLGPSRFAFVSDKSDGTAPCNRKDESIHIFELTGSLP